MLSKTDRIPGLLPAKLTCNISQSKAIEHDTTAINCSITVVQNFALNSLNLGLFDKKVYSAILSAKLGIIIEK